ncbi:MAG TPA: AtpZ/AtpI family protein [Planctomycetota bacterium]|nr:AtpZ/AtpI family protein [Planctomycetota bacterium]
MGKPDPERFRKWGELAGIGPTLAASVIAGYLLGSWLDRTLGTAPWLMVTCVLLGTVAGFVELIRLLNRLGESNRKRRKLGDFEDDGAVGNRDGDS